MKNTKDLLDYLLSDEAQGAIQRKIEANRQEEIAFRRNLVADYNRQLEAEGRTLGVSARQEQQQFIDLSMATDEVQAMAANYAKQLGRSLPPPPPSLAVDDV